jgi:hypothetical protein
LTHSSKIGAGVTKHLDLDSPLALEQHRKETAENEAGRGIRPEDQYRHDKLCAFLVLKTTAPQGDRFLCG